MKTNMYKTPLKMKKWYIVAFAAALVIRVVVAIPLVHDWDGFVFSESAKNMLHGITPYETVEENDAYIYPNSDSPMLQQWYAYPPLPLLMFTFPYFIAELSGIDLTPVLENVALKSPFIFGDLLFAFLVFIFLCNKSVKSAEHAMLLVLFNPLLIWVSSAWGMFDIWILNFILLFLISLRARAFVLAGFFLALAPEVKLFAVFFLPAIFVYILQTTEKLSQRVKVFASFVITTLIFVLPFLLHNPQGFLNQNLLMHLHRTPQGIGVVAILDYLSHIYSFNIAHIVTIGGILMLFSIVLFNLFSIAYVKGRADRLLLIILLIYTGVLVFNKVVNEQYFVVFVGLLILINYFPSEILMFSRKFLKIIKAVATFSVLFAGVVLGFHFLTFLPPFLSEGYLGESTNNLVFFLSKVFADMPLYAYPNSIWTYYNLPVVATYVILSPLIIMCFYLVLKGWLQVFQARREIYVEIISYVRAIRTFFTIKSTIISAIVLLAIVSASIPLNNFLQEKNAFKLIDLVDENAQELPPNPKVGTFYYTWWNNASLRDDIAGDAWDKVTTSPENGYYTSKNSYFVKHITQMKDAGIDFAVVSYHLYDRDRYLTFAEYANKLGLYYAPLIETGDVIGKEKFRPVDSNGSEILGFSLTDESLSELERTVLSSVEESYVNPASLKINNKTVIFVYDGHWFFPSWDDEFKKRLTQRIVEKYRMGNVDPFEAVSNSWKVSVLSENEMFKYYPQDIVSFNNEEQSAKDYRQAFLLEYKTYWNKIKRSVEEKVGPVYIISTYTQPTQNEDSFVIKADDILGSGAFDNEFFYSLSNTWVNWRYITNRSEIMRVWDTQEKEQTVRDVTNNVPTILTVTPTYKDTIIRGEHGFEIPVKIDGRSVYDWTWETAIENEADYVLVATWNEFFEGTAIEPTKEYGDFYLQETKRWIKEYKK